MVEEASVESPMNLPNTAEPTDFFTRLKSMVNALTSASTVEAVIQAVSAYALPAMGTTNGVVALLSEDGEMFRSVVISGRSESQEAAWRTFPVSMPNSVSIAVRERRTVAFNTKADFLAAFPGFVGSDGLLDGAVVAVPMLLDTQVVGAIGLSYLEARRFSEWEVAFLETAATQCAQAIDRARLLEEERKGLERVSQQRANQKLRGIVDCLSDAIVAFDPDMRLIACNRAFEQLFTAAFGTQPYAKMSVPEALAKYPEDAAILTVRWKRALAGEVFTTVREFETPTSTSQFFETSYSSIRDESGRITGAVQVSRNVTANATSEQALKKGAAQLAEAQSVANIGSWNMDMTSGKTEWSDEMYHITEFDRAAGLPPGDAIMARFRYSDESGKAEWESAASDSSEPYENDTQLNLEGNRTKWVHQLGRVQTNESGQIIRKYGTLMDVTERKLAEIALARLTGILESTSDIVVITDLDDNIVYCNRSFRVFFGVSEPQPSALNIRDFFATAWKPQQVEDVTQGLILDGFWNGETAFVSSAGKETPVSLKVFTLPDTSGSAKYRSAMARDITEQKSTEAALVKAQARLDDAQHIARFGSWEMDVATGIIVMSGEFIRQLECGSYHTDFRFSEMLSLYLPEDAARLDAAVKRAINRGTKYELDLRRVQRDGSVRCFHEIGNPISNSVGNVTRLVHTCMDTTEQQALEGQIRQAQKMETLGAFSGAIAHDLNNLLAIIMGNAELMADVKLEKPDFDASVQSIQNAVDRGSKLTQQLLGFAHKQAISPLMMQPNDLLIGMTTMLRPLLGQSIELAAHFGPNIGSVYIDSNQLEEVIVTLVVNARDAMPEGGKLTLEKEDVVVGDEVRKDLIPPGPYVLITVSDTGTGMTRSVQDRIFEPFFTTKEKGKGTGLGLATVYGIMKQNSGFISVNSKVGSGSSFQIYLPSHVESPAINVLHNEEVAQEAA